jgi:hypothetical protein
LAAERSRPIVFNARIGAATVGAAALVAQQVIGKALRDTLFLGSFGIEKLPYAMAAGAVLSGLFVLGVSRAGVGRTPRRVARGALLLSMALLLAAWAVSARSLHGAAALTYLHAGAVSAATVSIFWSLVSESFNPYTARGAVSRIMAGATLGGVLGGLVTWRAARWVAATDLLPLAAALNLVCFAAVSRLRRGALHAAVPKVQGGGLRPLLAEVRPLRSLALLVLAGAATQAILDYLLSSAAVTSLGTGPRLLSFFAIFQTAVGVLSFLVQVGVSRSALERFGVGPALAASPLFLLGGLLAGTYASPLAAAVLLRGTDGVVGASLHRSAYEVLFAPIEPRKKRAWKPLLDVACDRVGMLIGSALVALVAVLAPAVARPVLLGAVAALAFARIILTPRLETGYRESLAENLRRGRVGLSGVGVLDRGTVSAISRVSEEMNRPAMLREIASLRSEQERAPEPEGGRLSIAAFDLPVYPEPDEDAGSPDAGPDEDDVLVTLGELRSGDERRVAAVLRRLRSEPLLAPQVVALLADDSVARDAADWLTALEPAPIGLLTDALLSEALSDNTRRRVARLLGKIADPRAAAGLVDALPVVPAGVRPGVVDAIARASERTPLAREPLLDAVRRFASEQRGEEPVSLEPIFSLLAAAYPGEPVRAALRALERGGDGRGTALEWLDVLLPQDVKLALLPRIVRRGERVRPRSRTAEDLRRALGSLPLATERERDAGGKP